MSIHNHIPRTVEASLDARIAAFQGVRQRSPLEDLDIEVSRSVSPRTERVQKLSLIKDLKLLFAALGAGGATVPLGDDGHAARMLANYAQSLRDH